MRKCAKNNGSEHFYAVFIQTLYPHPLPVLTATLVCVPRQLSPALDLNLHRMSSTYDFTHLRRQGEFSDALIRVGQVVFPVHRNILACCSPYFRALFTDLDRRKGKYPDEPNLRLESGPALEGGPAQVSSRGTETSLTRLRQSEPLVTTTPCVYLDRCPTLNYVPLTRGSSCSIFNDGDSQTSSSRHSTESSSSGHLSDHSSGHSSPASFKRRRISPSPRLVSSAPTTTSWSHPNSQGLRAFVALDNPKRSSFYQLMPSLNEDNPRYAGVLREEDAVTLQDVSPDIMNDIIEFAYGGQVLVSASNVEQLLPAADRFQVTGLMKACCDFLVGELSLENCISIVKFASHFYQCDQLREKGTQFVLDNFTSIVKASPEFGKLTCKELMSLLRADQLNVKYEELVLDAIIRWVSLDVEDREQYIPELVCCARVGLMFPDHMRHFVDSWLLTGAQNSQVNRVTIQLMESVLQLQRQQINELDLAMFSARLPRDVLFVIGGSNFGFPLNLVEAFDSRTWSWSLICPYEFAPRSYHGMVSLEKEIYIMGGYSGQVYLSSCCKFRPETLAWEDVTPMNTRRCYVGAAALKGFIYAVGGYDGVYRLNSAERFDKSKNQWSFISPMSHQRSDAGVAVLDDRLYVCGGFNGTECIKDVEVYLPETDRWFSEPDMPASRSGLGVVGYQHRLYAVGGFDGSDSSVRLALVECYDPATRQWTSLSSMPHPRSNLAVEVLEDTLYAIGGYSGDRTTSLVECYDFTSHTWYSTTRLSHNCSALGVCVVSGLPNTAEILRRQSPGVRPRMPVRES